MSVYVRSSDQRCQRFAQAVEVHQQGFTVNCFILYIKTRWNSTYHMCSRFLHLRYVLVNCFFNSLVKLFFFQFDIPTVTKVYPSNVDYQKFALFKEEWKKLGQLMKFLQPLNTSRKGLRVHVSPRLRNLSRSFFPHCSIAKGAKQ